MSARKASNVDPGDSVASSRQRRVNAGVPRRNADGTIYDTSAARTQRAAKEAKTSATTEIEASEFTGDDSIAREPLPSFSPPTPTGDEEEDQKRFDECRLDFLIRFIGIRDGVDVRPDLVAGKLDLAGLEEINKDPEAAAEYQFAATQLDAAPVSTGKGKSRAITPPSTTGRVQEETGYAGISIDSDSQTVQAKYAGKPNLRQWTPSQGTKRLIEQDDNARKAQRTAPPASSGLEHPPSTPSNALSRSDHTTLLDGKQLKYPVYSAPNPSPASKDANTADKSNRHASAQHASKVNNKTSTRVVSSPAQLAPSSAPTRANNNQKSSGNQLISQSGSTQPHHSNAAALASGSATRPTTARAAIDMLRQRGRIPQPAPTQAAPAPQLDANEGAVTT
ncbi:hypothetical protein FRC12_011005 [Ceratobasidium sp. 428]|nr:hypothetical protein FRC12_011005 [Ceratobasidium sp. 428]